MSTSQPKTITFHADQEHAGLRAVILLIVIGGFIIAFLAIHSLLSRGDGLAAAYASPLSCILGLTSSLAVAALAESWMKRHWPSGRRVEIDDQQLRAWLPEGETVKLSWSGHVRALKWSFSLAGYPRGGRERRLTRRHHCLACQLQQDNKRVIIYSYLRGPRARALLEGDDFQAIKPADFYEKNPLRRLRAGTDRPTIPTNVLTGKKGLYWLAEQRRWAGGIELAPRDFLAFWELVKGRLEG